MSKEDSSYSVKPIYKLSKNEISFFRCQTQKHNISETQLRLFQKSSIQIHSFSFKVFMTSTNVRILKNNLYRYYKYNK
jgi:hypothetical protein